MIPIECPKCGREGNVPPDRLNAKLTCRGCQAVFHLDNSGRMVMGAPGDPEKDRQRPHVQYSRPGEPFNLGEALANIPKPVRFGVPLVLVAALAWPLLPGSGAPDYQSGAAAIIRGLLAGDRSKVVSYATSTSGEASGKWFDLLSGQVKKMGIPPDAPVTPALFSGNPEKDSALVMMAVLIGNSPGSSPLPLNLYLVRDGGSWRLDGARMLSDAESKVVTSTKRTR